MRPQSDCETAKSVAIGDSQICRNQEDGGSRNTIDEEFAMGARNFARSVDFLGKIDDIVQVNQLLESHREQVAHL